MNIFTRKTTKTEWLFFAFLTAFISIDLIFFNQTGYTAGRLFTVLFLLINLPVSVSYNIFSILFSLPFSGILKFSVSGVSVLPILYLTVIGKLFLSNKIRLTSKNFIALCLVAIQQVLAVLLWNNELTSAISAMLSIVFVCAVVYSKTDLGGSCFLENACLFFAGSVFIETVCARVLTQIPYFISYEKQASMERAGRFAAYNIDPNEYVQMLMVGLMLLAIYLLTTKFSFFSLIALAVFAVLFLSGIQSYSKSYALTVALLALFVAFRFLMRIRRKYGAKGLVFALLPLLVIGTVTAIYLYRDVVIAIFENRSKDDLLTGRGEIWKQYLEGMLLRPDTPLITGCGFNNCLPWLHAIGINGIHVPHNIYIEYLLEYGLPSLIALGYAWRDIIKKSFAKLTSENNLVLLSFAISGFGISSNANDCIYIVLILLWLLPVVPSFPEKE